MHNGYRLDWCLNWTQGCGKPAADEFCRQNGYASASDWDIDHDIMVPTAVIGNSGQICDASFCDGFDFIYCTG